MKVIFNDTIPFKGFMAMCLWPFIFVRNNAASHYNTWANNHEHIHAEQQKEMMLTGAVLAAIGYLLGFGLWAILFVPVFFWWYGIEYLIRLCQYQSTKEAYRNISFEREAYANEKDLAYLTARKRFAWIKFLHIQ